MIEEQQEQRVTQYLIPSNVATRFEFFDGFGWYELKIVSMALLIGAIIFFILGLPKKTVNVDSNAISFEESISTNSGEVEQITERVPKIPTPIRTIIFLVPGMGAFFIVKKDPSSGMSLMITIKSSNAFNKKQKRYLYKYGSGTGGK